MKKSPFRHVEGMGEFFTEDMEVYHDRGGMTVGLPNFVGVLRVNLCGNPDSRLRREAVAGTVRVAEEGQRALWRHSLGRTLVLHLGQGQA